jgi:molybdopterin-containing oxidoreductase family iron-sulfur binding subunit
LANSNGSLSRREFIKRAAAIIGLSTLALSTTLMTLRRVMAADGETGNNTSLDKLRQWCMVVDLRKCDGCTGLDLPPQCLQACIQGHFIPKDQKWIEIYTIDLQGTGTYFMPVPCFQCENAPCVNVCPVAATYHVDSGVVLIDQRRCIGCRMCMAACP